MRSVWIDGVQSRTGGNYSLVNGGYPKKSSSTDWSKPMCFLCCCVGIVIVCASLFVGTRHHVEPISRPRSAVLHGTRAHRAAMHPPQVPRLNPKPDPATDPNVDADSGTDAHVVLFDDEYNDPYTNANPGSGWPVTGGLSRR